MRDMPLYHRGYEGYASLPPWVYEECAILHPWVYEECAHITPVGMGDTGLYAPRGYGRYWAICTPWYMVGIHLSWYMPGIAPWVYPALPPVSCATRLLPVPGSVSCENSLGSVPKNSLGERQSPTLGPQRCDSWWEPLRRVTPVLPVRKCKDRIATGSFKAQELGGGSLAQSGPHS